ncbi:hypothetical protein KH172YL63_34150 [Bacillus sp. KH172YL63]|nr:hypothetical protein KH172YL63_34150 [Bacillus sp. KH172YL63]
MAEATAGHSRLPNRIHLLNRTEYFYETRESFGFLSFFLCGWLSAGRWGEPDIWNVNDVA